MNSLFREMSTRNSLQNPTIMGNISKVRNMMNLVKSNSNPAQALHDMAQSNPQLNQVMSMMNNSGGKSAKDLFYSQAQKMGIDPDQIINMLK